MIAREPATFYSTVFFPRSFSPFHYPPYLHSIPLPFTTDDIWEKVACFNMDLAFPTDFQEREVATCKASGPLQRDRCREV